MPTDTGRSAGLSRVFGPVPSRRLGLSLGIDLIPPKTCTYDCIYCEAGRTTVKTVSPASFFPPEEIERELKAALKGCRPHVMTLAGSGEPTLSTDLEDVIGMIRGLSSVPVVILTNGSLLWREDVLRRCLKADIIMPTLTSLSPSTFERIHRHHKDLNLHRVIQGLKALRSAFSGRIYLEVMLLKGLNDSKEEVEAMAESIEEIMPDKVQLNTVVRPPSEPSAEAVGQERLEAIRRLFGDKAEIVAGFSAGSGKGLSTKKRLLETLARRPLTEKDISHVMGISKTEADSLIAELRLRGRIVEREFNGELYLALREEPLLSDG
jgi:wyosine [tRNA(Phe)-imidazoG37] synthetase (radical SAM superfamily)